MSDSTKNVTFHFKGQAAEWDAYDLPSQLQVLFQSGYSIDLTTGKISARKSSGWETPWIYTKSIDCKKCNMDHNIKFNNYNYIPPRCLGCWKVTITPRNFSEMMTLHKTQLAMDVPCKLGIEVRDYVPKLYGGYYYCRSLDEGRERYEQVKKIADTEFPKIDGEGPAVLLKRGCTEFEFKLGPSPYWIMPDKMKETDELLEMYIEDSGVYNGTQTKFQKAHVFKKWIKWAHSHGDMSYLPWNGGEPVVGDYVKFHEGDIDDIKDEIALAEAVMKAQQNNVAVDPDVLVKFRGMVQRYGIETNTDPEYLSKVMDYMTVPRELANGSDQTT